MPGNRGLGPGARSAGACTSAKGAMAANGVFCIFSATAPVVSKAYVKVAMAKKRRRATDMVTDGIGRSSIS